MTGDDAAKAARIEAAAKVLASLAGRLASPADFLHAAALEGAGMLVTPRDLDQRCNDCGAPNDAPWFADNDLWNDVTNANGDGGPFICLNCFDRLAVTAGHPITGWHVTPELKGDPYQGRAERAEAEAAELEGKLSLLLWELTGTRMSKTGYDVRTMVGEVAAYFERTQDDEVAELRAQVAAVRALRDNWSRLAAAAIDPDTREWVTAAAKSLHAALDPEGGGSDDD